MGLVRMSQASPESPIERARWSSSASSGVRMSFMGPSYVCGRRVRSSGFARLWLAGRSFVIFALSGGIGNEGD